MDEELKSVKAVDSACVSLLVPRNSLKRQLQIKSDIRQKVAVLKDRLDRAVAKDRRSKTIINSPQEQLLSVRFDVDKYCRRLSPYTDRFTADVADDFSGFLYNLGTEATKLVVKQRKDIDSTVRDLEDIDAFLSSSDSKLSRSGPSSYNFS